MVLSWKSFKVDLPSFQSWLKQNIAKSDGIVASETECVIIETTPFSAEEISTITTYFNSLTESGENEKRELPTLLQTKYMEIKEAAVLKDWDIMTILERKIIARVPLTDEDKEELLSV